MYYITHYTVQLPYKRNEIKVKWMYASRSTVDEYAIVLKLTETYLNIKKTDKIILNTIHKITS